MDSFYIWHKLLLSLEGVSHGKFFYILEILIVGKFMNFFGLDLDKKYLQFSMDSFHV